MNEENKKDYRIGIRRAIEELRDFQRTLESISEDLSYEEIEDSEKEDLINKVESVLNKSYELEQEYFNLIKLFKEGE